MSSLHCMFGVRFTGTVTAIAAFFGASLLAAPLPPQLSKQQREQVRQQSMDFASQPARVSVKALTQGTKVGETSRLEITLMTPNDEPIAAKEDQALEVSLTSPSGKVSTKDLTIKKGQSSAPFEFLANEHGLTSVTVRSKAGGIRPDKTDVLTVPTAGPKRPGKIAKTKSSSKLFALPNGFDSLVRVMGTADSRSARFQLAGFSSPTILRPKALIQQNDSAQSNNSPEIHIQVNDTGSDFFANGKNAAVISAYFESPNGTPAPRDIHIWFTWTNGQLDPRPLRIAKGEFSGEAHLTSHWPATVHVRFVSISPSYDVKGDKEFDLRFVPPGFAIVGPERLSVVDSEPIMVVFSNEQGVPIVTGADWKVTLHSTQSKLRFVPGLVEVKNDSALGATSLFPLSVGHDKIEAIVPDYQPKPLEIVITGWFVLFTCIVGGLAGGLAAYGTLHGSFWWRLFFGVLGGLILSWLYIYLALPKVDINVAHNPFSVMFVSIIGGYLGITVLDFAAGQFRLKPPVPPAPPAPPQAPQPQAP